MFPHVALVAAQGTVAGGHRRQTTFSSRSASPLPLAGIKEGLAQRGDWSLAGEADTAAFAGSAEVLTDDRAPVDQLVTTYPIR